MEDDIVATTAPEEKIAQSIVPETVLAYIAGMLDGDGRVSIKTHHGRRQINPSFSLMVSIDNTAISVINFTHQHLGGAIGFSKRGRFRTLYHLAWYADNAQAVLKLLLPYLVIKKEIAEIGIAFQGIRQLKDGLRSDSIPKWQLEIMEVMYGKSRQLNLRGSR